MSVGSMSSKSPPLTKARSINLLWLLIQTAIQAAQGLQGKSLKSRPPLKAKPTTSTSSLSHKMSSRGSSFHPKSIRVTKSRWSITSLGGVAQMITAPIPSWAMPSIHLITRLRVSNIRTHRMGLCHKSQIRIRTV